MSEEFRLLTNAPGVQQTCNGCTVCSRCRTRYCGPTCAKRHYEDGHSLDLQEDRPARRRRAMNGPQHNEAQQRHGCAVDMIT